MENFFRFMAAVEMFKNQVFLLEACERFDKQALLQIHDDFGRRVAESVTEGRFQIHSSFTDPISSAGAACSVPLERLNPISFNELEVGEVHRGRVVYGTLCAKLNQMCGIMTLLEDDSGLAIRLAIYNVAASQAGIQKLYPKGAKVAIKEPYFKIAIDGGLLIRVDNPANVVKLVIQKEKRTMSPVIVDVEDIREKGNRCFKERIWDAAAEHYTTCIDAALLQLKEGGSSSGKKKIKDGLLHAYSNRAETSLQMKEFKRALEDCNEVLRIDPRHLKALYRKGRALLGLRNYGAACECLKKADKTSPGHKEIQEVLGQAMTLYAQSVNGKYDISDYLLGVKPTSSLPEVADFVGPVEIKMTEDGRGRGLYATREIKTGELFLVSNPVAVAHESAFPTMLYSEKTVNMASQEELVAAVVCAANKSQRLLRQLYSLCHSSTSGSLDVPPIDLFKMNDQEEQNENLVVDVNRIREIISLSKFIEAIDTDFSKSEIHKARLDPQLGQSGLWLLPSFINHSCLPNSKRLDVGSAMFFHASKPIKRGEEITVSYFDTLLPLPQRRAKCKNVWGFRCNCRRCILEHSLRASLGPLTNARFDRLHAKAMEELIASRTQQQPFDAHFPACAEFLRLSVEAEEIIRNSDVLKTEEEKHWIRASFVSAYMAGTQSESFHSTMMNGCFPSGQKIMKGIQCTVPGDLRNLNMAAWEFKHFFRWMGDENESLITRQALEHAREACISVFGKHSEDVLKALILQIQTQ